MLTVKRLYGLSYEQTEYQVKESLVLQQLCRVYFNDVPDDTTLIRWANLVKAETLDAYNQRVTQLATELKVTQGRKLRTDGTVVESNIHAPSDSRLLADSVRVIGRTLQRAKHLLSRQTGLDTQVFCNRTRSSRKTACQIHRLMARQKEAGKQAYRKLIQITKQSVAQAKHVLEALEKSNLQHDHRLKDNLDTFIPRAEQSSNRPSDDARLASQLSTAAKSGSMKLKAVLSLVGSFSMATPTTNFRYLAWMPTNNALASLLLKPAQTVAFSLWTMKPKPNAIVSKGLCCPNRARSPRNLVSTRNNPGSARLANGMLVSKVVSLCSNAATISIVVSITAKMVFNDIRRAGLPTI
jgi:IS5 family transposase